MLWFAFKLVSLNHWKQQAEYQVNGIGVVICFQISIFEPLETTRKTASVFTRKLWFAFKLVSLNHWKQQYTEPYENQKRCDLLSNQYLWTIGNNLTNNWSVAQVLWFAFKLVSLNHWKQLQQSNVFGTKSCDLLSN